MYVLGSRSTKALFLGWKLQNAGCWFHAQRLIETIALVDSELTP